MKFQSHLIIPLMGSLHFASAQKVFTISKMQIQSFNGDAGPWTYKVYLWKHGEEGSEPANCIGVDPNDPNGEQRMKCTRIDDTSRERIDLVNELNVRIQQPAGRNPLNEGFNVLINWR